MHPRTSLGSQVSRWLRVATALTTRWGRDWPPRESAQCQVGGVSVGVCRRLLRRRRRKRASFSLIKSSRARVRRSESFCSFAPWRRCSSFHKPHPPRSAGMNKASFCQSSSPGFVPPLSEPSRRRISRTPSSSSTRALEEDGCFSAGMHSLSRQLAACTAGRPAGAWQ